MNLSLSQEEMNANLFHMLFTVLEEQYEMKLMLYSLVTSSGADSDKLYAYIDSQKANYKNNLLNNLFEQFGEIPPEIYSLLKTNK